MKRKSIVTMLCVATLAANLGSAQTNIEAASSANRSTVTGASAGDLEQLRQQIAQQEEEIKHLQASVKAQQELLEKSLAAAKTVASSATTNDGTAVVAAHNIATPNLIPAVNLDRQSGPNQHESTNPASPLSITIGNTTWTPLGFMDMTFFARSSNVGSGIGTNFAGIPFNNSAADHLSEMNFSAQNSRIGFRVDSTFMGAKVLGYLESDFLFNNDANSFQVTSNSAGLRLRNYFVDVQKNGFEVMGGQDWSFLTPNRKGLSPLPSDIFYTQNMDTNYQVGLTWTRAPQFRFIAHPNEDFAFGVALENPQQYIGGGSGASTVTLPNNLSAALSTQFNSGQSATAIPNLFPDIIAKAAYDAHAGDKLLHFEAAGLADGFKDYIPSTAKKPAVAGTHTSVGYGGQLDMNLEVVKNFRLIENFYASDGGGRFIFGIAPDAAVQPTGAITPLHSYSTVDGFEAQFSPKNLLAMYYGAAYVGREVIFDPTGSAVGKPAFVGYGFTGSSTNNRTVQEITADWVRTLWKNPSYGALSLINQYSYLFREPWYVGTGPKATHTNMVYVDLRYTLP